MEGMKFLMLDENGPANHGVIQKKLTDERYLVTFARIPVVSRVAHLDEISGWNLFPGDKALNEFIAEFQKHQQAAEPALPAELTESIEQTTNEKPARRKAKGLNRNSK